MKRTVIGKAWGWAALLLLGIPSTARAAEWFVATNGSDVAAGTTVLQRFVASMWEPMRCFQDSR